MLKYVCFSHEPYCACILINPTTLRSRPNSTSSQLSVTNNTRSSPFYREYDVPTSRPPVRPPRELPPADHAGGRGAISERYPGPQKDQWQQCDEHDDAAQQQKIGDHRSALPARIPKGRWVVPRGVRMIRTEEEASFFFDSKLSNSYSE